MADLAETADVAAVGDGSAGAVLAARLSQDPARPVLLLKAGHAHAPDAYPPALLDANKIADPDHARDLAVSCREHIEATPELTDGERTAIFGATATLIPRLAILRPRTRTPLHNATGTSSSPRPRSRC